MMTVSYLKEVSHEVVGCDPPIQPFFLTRNDGSILEGERQRTQVVSEIRQDFIGPPFILLTCSKTEKGTELLTDSIVIATDHFCCQCHYSNSLIIWKMDFYAFLVRYEVGINMLVCKLHMKLELASCLS